MSLKRKNVLAYLSAHLSPAHISSSAIYRYQLHHRAWKMCEISSFQWIWVSISVSLCVHLGGKWLFISIFSVLCCKRGTLGLLGHWYFTMYADVKCNSYVVKSCGVFDVSVTFTMHSFVYCVGIWLEGVKVIVNTLYSALPWHSSLVFIAVVFCSYMKCCSVSVLFTSILSQFFHEPLILSWLLNEHSSHRHILSHHLLSLLSL